MPKKPKPLIREGEPTQVLPSGLEIPVPTRGQFFRDLGKVVKKER